MGGDGGYGKKPGAANAVDVASNYGAGSVVGQRNVVDSWNQALAPGKQALTGDANQPTGEAYFDGKAECDTKRPDCFLTDTQRTRIVSGYQLRVNSALGSYQQALQSLRVDKLMEKGDGDLSWMLSLLLDFIGGHALTALTSALTVIRKADLASLQRMVILDPGGETMTSHAASLMHQYIGVVTPKELGTLSKLVVDQAKKGVAANIKKQITDEKSDKQKEAVGYLDRLMDESSIAFQELRERPPGVATDAQLLVLWEGFDGAKHTPGAYKQALAAKLARFQASGVNTIGRDWGWRRNSEAAEDPLVRYAPVVRDRAVIKVVFKSGRPVRYAYANNDWLFDTSSTTPAERSLDEDALPMSPETLHGQPIPSTSRFGRGEFETFIDPEFEGVAVERHLQIWGEEPKAVTVDDSSWSFLAPWPGSKSQPSSSAPAQASGAQTSIPRLQLGQSREECTTGENVPDEVVQ